MSGAALRLRPLRQGDEAAALAAHAELEPEDFPFLLDHDRTRPWDAHVATMERWRRGLDLPPDRVRAAFLLAQVGPDVVGRSSIRFVLTPTLAERGGHVGYAVRPAFRGRGLAREVLRQSLVVARSEGVERVLLTCDSDNRASAAVVLACGGVEDDSWVAPDGGVVRRFWID